MGERYNVALTLDDGTTSTAMAPAHAPDAHPPFTVYVIQGDVAGTVYTNPVQRALYEHWYEASLLEATIVPKGFANWELVSPMHTTPFAAPLKADGQPFATILDPAHA